MKIDRHEALGAWRKKRERGSKLHRRGNRSAIERYRYSDDNDVVVNVGASVMLEREQKGMREGDGRISCNYERKKTHSLCKSRSRSRARVSLIRASLEIIKYEGIIINA